MPMLLEAVPSFAEQWSEIEDDPMFLDEATGTRLHTDGDDYVKELASLAAGGGLNAFWSGKIPRVQARDAD
jgi:hypothetical protein